MSNQATDGLAPSEFDHFSGVHSWSGLLRFSVNERRGPEARNRELGFASCSRGLVFPQGGTTAPKCQGLVFPDGDMAGPKFEHGF